MKNSKLLIVLLSVLLVSLSGCESEPRKITYIKTERGLMHYSAGYCELGMLTNNDRYNILDENSKPITCDGYIELTDAEKRE
jgi:hypothetical protein